MTMNVFDFLEENSGIQVKKKPWMEDVVMELATVETLPGIIQKCIDAEIYGLDLETTGLDNRVFNGRTVDLIVGVCLAPNRDEGYYIPLRHAEGGIKSGGELYKGNIPIEVFRKEFKRIVDSDAVAVFHNGKFDQEFLEYDGSNLLGEWDSFKAWDDTMVLAYLRNTREKKKGLKWLSEVELDRGMIELPDLFPEDHSGDLDFSELDPEWDPVVWYAASDAMNTVGLRDPLWNPVVNIKRHSQSTIYKIEKMCVAATRWMERNRIPIDRDKVAELIKIANRDYFKALSKVYEEASRALNRDITPNYFKLMRGDFEGETKFRFDPNNVSFPITDQIQYARKQAPKFYPDPANPEGEYPVVYDIKSPSQFGHLLDELKVPGLRRTDSGKQFNTSKKELDRLTEMYRTRVPFLDTVKTFREIDKALGTYLIPLYQHTGEDGTIRVSFSGHKVDTGRFATPSSKRIIKPGWPKFNLQSIPAGYDPKRPECMRRMREVIRAREGYYILAVDFSGVELRIVTNLSREPLWLAEYFRCSGCGFEFDNGDGQSTPEPPSPFCPRCGSDKIGDLHTLTAKNVYGDEYTRSDKKMKKHLRQNGKAANFALCYGGGGNAVVRATGVAENEGWRIKRKFDGSYKTLAAWWEAQKNFARKNGYVLTSFGRRYPVPDINHGEGGFRSKAERNSINGPIQATSADITKIAMALIYKECKKRGWLDEVRMIITMHDELVFEIKAERMQEAIPLIRQLMTRNKLILSRKWPIPLTTDAELGKDWTVPWNITEFQHGKAEWPEELKPFFQEDVKKSAEIVAAEGTVKKESPSEVTEEFEYQLKKPLTISMMHKLAHAIMQSRTKTGLCLSVTDQKGSVIHYSEVPERVDVDRFMKHLGEADV